MVYEEAPWVFKGRALFQLQLVKVEEARRYVPESLKLVSLFGYTLGGFFLSRYTDSPVGPMDEFVALGGLVWDPPTSCAWAARVYVNDRDARNHGLKIVGLPSRMAHFQATGPPAQPGVAAQRDWWSAGEAEERQDCSGEGGERALVLHNRESGPWWWRQRPGHRGLPHPVCRLVLPPASRGWPGPRMCIALPSFSGSTPECPAILKYTCVLHTNVAPVQPAQCHADGEGSGDRGEVLASILNGKPLLALNFSNMVMSVDEAAEHEPRVARSVQPKGSLVTAWCGSLLGGAAARRQKQRAAWTGVT